MLAEPAANAPAAPPALRQCAGLQPGQAVSLWLQPSSSQGASVLAADCGSGALRELSAPAGSAAARQATLAASGARFPFLKEAIEIRGFQVKSLSKSKRRILQLLRRRFKLYKSDKKLRSYAMTMIDDAYDNFWTRTYAKFQLLTNGIPP